MRFDVLTIFPEIFPGPLGVGVVGRATSGGSLELVVHDLRDFSEGKHRQVDDIAYGGGPGMVLKPEPIVRALRHVRSQEPQTRAIILSPRGRTFTQEVAQELAAETNLMLICGRYQGIDERVHQVIDDDLSVGNFVLSGGEVAAMTVIEAVARLVPGVVGSPESLNGETFSGEVEGGCEPPLYTRPAEFEGMEVPAVLRGGDHAAIVRWRKQQSEETTRRHRPDLVRFGAVPWR